MTTYTHSQIKSALLRARTLLADPQRWVKGQERRPLRAGADVPEGYAYCSLGAINQAANFYNNDDMLVRDPGLARVTRSSFESVVGDTITVWNDRRVSRHSQVLDAFDKAIAREGALARLEGSGR